MNAVRKASCRCESGRHEFFREPDNAERAALLTSEHPACVRYAALEAASSAPSARRQATAGARQKRGKKTKWREPAARQHVAALGRRLAEVARAVVRGGCEQGRQRRACPPEARLRATRLRTSFGGSTSVRRSFISKAEGGLRRARRNKNWGAAVHASLRPPLRRASNGAAAAGQIDLRSLLGTS